MTPPLPCVTRAVALKRNRMTLGGVELGGGCANSSAHSKRGDPPARDKGPPSGSARWTRTRASARQLSTVLSQQGGMSTPPSHGSVHTAASLMKSPELSDQRFRLHGYRGGLGARIRATPQAESRMFAVYPRMALRLVVGAQFPPCRGSAALRGSIEAMPTRSSMTSRLPIGAQRCDLRFGSISPSDRANATRNATRRPQSRRKPGLALDTKSDARRSRGVEATFQAREDVAFRRRTRA
jgi:hypothetical protein